MSGKIKMLINKTTQTDGIAISSFDICQSTPISLGCASLIFVF